MKTKNNRNQDNKSWGIVFDVFLKQVLSAPYYHQELLTTANIISRFIQYFVDDSCSDDDSHYKVHPHQYIDSSSLIPEQDSSILFTNAGMNQFKNTFLGLETRPYANAVSIQNCLRAGGKHNDLENVGYTARHHTFFQMLGNFSFGISDIGLKQNSYFKKEAISYAWQFLTGSAKNELGLNFTRLYVTVYHQDLESYQLWWQLLFGYWYSFYCWRYILSNLLNPLLDHKSADDIKKKTEIELNKRIIKIKEKADGSCDNFWYMGSTGPCGPCTEIFYDNGDLVAGELPGSDQEDKDRYVEIWNLVFMQYNRDANGKLHNLPQPCVDTGMGLERITAIKQTTRHCDQSFNEYNFLDLKWSWGSDDYAFYKKITSFIYSMGNSNNTSNSIYKKTFEYITNQIMPELSRHIDIFKKPPSIINKVQGYRGNYDSEEFIILKQDLLRILKPDTKLQFNQKSYTLRVFSPKMIDLDGDDYPLITPITNHTIVYLQSKQKKYSEKNSDESDNKYQILRYNFLINIANIVVVLNIIADHLRAICHLFAVGLVPSSNDRGYVMRSLIRRMIIYNKLYSLELTSNADQFLDLSSSGYKSKIANLVTDPKIRSSFFFKDLKFNGKKLAKIIEDEENSCLSIIELAKNEIINYKTNQLNNQGGVIDGKFIFILKDRHGVPLEISTEIAKCLDCEIEMNSYQYHLQQQQSSSQQAQKFNTKEMMADISDIADQDNVDFIDNQYYYELSTDRGCDNKKMLSVYYDLNADRNYASNGLKIKSGLEDLFQILYDNYYSYHNYYTTFRFKNIYIEQVLQQVNHTQSLVTEISVITNQDDVDNPNYQYIVILSNTILYAESGGQIGDIGAINLVSQNKGSLFFIITNTKYIKTLKGKKVIGHCGYFTDLKAINIEQPIIQIKNDNSIDNYIADYRDYFIMYLLINNKHRIATTRNHTTTHLLHQALRQHLGIHIEQKGSLVSDQLLRFDFSHDKALTVVDLKAIETAIQDQIALQMPVVKLKLNKDEAQQQGYLGLFNYQDQVRCINIGFDDYNSKELCGGCHLSNSGQILAFKIIAEKSIAKGVRRITAITGEAAILYYKNHVLSLESLKQQYKVNIAPDQYQLADLAIIEQKITKQISDLKQQQQLMLDYIQVKDKANIQEFKKKYRRYPMVTAGLDRLVSSENEVKNFVNQEYNHYSLYQQLVIRKVLAFNVNIKIIFYNQDFFNYQSMFANFIDFKKSIMSKESDLVVIFSCDQDRLSAFMVSWSPDCNFAHGFFKDSFEDASLAIDLGKKWRLSQQKEDYVVFTGFGLD